MSEIAIPYETETVDRELTIVPYPQRSAWAVVNRRGDIIATGGYADCLRELGYLADRSA